MTYSPMPERHSTISATRFHVRVRYGIVCFTCAIITKPAVQALNFVLTAYFVDKVKNFLLILVQN